MDTIEIKRTKAGNCLVTMSERAWLLGEHWSEGHNPAELVGDLWFFAACDKLDQLPAKWARNEEGARLYRAGEPERRGIFS